MAAFSGKVKLCSMNEFWNIKEKLRDTQGEGPQKVDFDHKFKSRTRRLVYVAYLGVTRVCSSVGWRIRQVVKV